MTLIGVGALLYPCNDASEDCVDILSKSSKDVTYDTSFTIIGPKGDIRHSINGSAFL